MQTKDITRGALICALYGLLLLLNQQTGAWIETTFSWVGVFPIFIYTMQTNPKAGFFGLVAMILMTPFFGGFTTWFTFWTFLIIGYLYAIGMKKQISHMKNFIGLLIASWSQNALMILFWSSLFGFDLHQDFAMIQTFLPWIDFFVFTIMVIGFLALLQSLCIHLLAILLMTRLRIPMRPLTPIYQTHASRSFSIASILMCIIFFFSQNVLECSQGIIDFIQIIYFIDIVILIYYGVLYGLRFCIQKQRRKWTFFVILAAFIPGVQLIYAGLGIYDGLKQR